MILLLYFYVSDAIDVLNETVYSIVFQMDRAIRPLIDNQ